MNQTYISASLFSETATALIQRRPPSIFEPPRSNGSRNKLSTFIHCCAYYSGYFAEAYGSSKKHRAIEQHREISRHATEATNCLAHLWAIVDVCSLFLVDSLHKEIKAHSHSAAEAVCRSVYLSRHPKKSNPLHLANSLSKQVFWLEKYLHHFSQTKLSKPAKDAYSHLAAMTDELNTLRKNTGFMPQWPTRPRRGQTMAKLSTK
jgi:hypothetical protein